MFLSLIVPVYNGECHLAQCLASLLDQDLPPEDYEIVCVDDGSTDDSPAILADFAQKYQNIRILRQENAGVAAARNAGVAAARGDWLWFVDCDDLLLPGCLPGLKVAAEGSRCDRLTVGAYQFTDELSEEERRRSREGSLGDNAPWYDSVVWRSLLRRGFLEAHGIRFAHPELTHGEDGLYMYELTRFRPETVQVGGIVYFYRIHSDSAETAAGTAALCRRIRSHRRIAEILLGYYQSGRQDADTADKLMAMLWLCLYETARLPRAEEQTSLAELEAAGLFPFRRPAQCSVTRSYMSGMSGPAEKLFDAVYLRQHTRPGYALMRLTLHLLGKAG